MVECIPDIPVCKKINAVPVNENDYEILVINYSHIPFSLSLSLSLPPYPHSNVALYILK